MTVDVDPALIFRALKRKLRPSLFFYWTITRDIKVGAPKIRKLSGAKTAAWQL